jgi:hypothetical protein
VSVKAQKAAAETAKLAEQPLMAAIIVIPRSNNMYV